MVDVLDTNKPSCPKKSLLTSLVEALYAKRDEEAQGVLERLVRDHLDPDQNPEDLIYYVFTSALSKRLQSKATDEINLYLKKYENTQIDLFNLVARHMPFVGGAGQLANLHLAPHMAGQERVTYLNIGIGTGRQEVALLELLKEQDQLPRQMTVIAVEPFLDALTEAERAIREACGRLGVEVDVRTLHTVSEELTDADWESFRPTDGSPLLINSAFALHHIRGVGEEAGTRERVFGKLGALQPAAVVLCEPNSDHFHSDLPVRFAACWHHFSHVFDFIDRIETTGEEKIALKMFFVREIEDILGNREENRYERHERAQTWAARLQSAGFELMIDEEAMQKVARLHPLMEVVKHEGYIGLDYRGETLVAVFCGV
ncbi:hypothetical protein OS242_00070 [Tumebacillus sp. DT12]|uniref:GAI protein n=1 Tax=Tumebacillus lacus TaxID=2995335 RepID=A0ABT3WUS2_9BACL|nr:GRAS family protein [Tumebacillus lacus]MCX7568366.1 hypothetical protein [Tumebacillus lacus]